MAGTHPPTPHPPTPTQTILYEAGDGCDGCDRLLQSVGVCLHVGVVDAHEAWYMKGGVVCLHVGVYRWWGSVCM